MQSFGSNDRLRGRGFVFFFKCLSCCFIMMQLKIQLEILPKLSELISKSDWAIIKFSLAFERPQNYPEIPWLVEMGSWTGRRSRWLWSGVDSSIELTVVHAFQNIVYRHSFLTSKLRFQFLLCVILPSIIRFLIAISWKWSFFKLRMVFLSPQSSKVQTGRYWRS